MKTSPEILKKGVLILGLLGLLLVQYQNCSSYSDPSPFEQSSKLDTPGISPSKIQLNISMASVVGDRIEVMGSCSPGPYKSYSLQFQFKEGAVLKREYSVPCDHGQFHFLIHYAPFCTPLTERLFGLNGTLNINDPGVEVRPVTSSFNISRVYCP